MISTLPEWTVALDPGTQLGEGLHWDAPRACLWFVDIHGQRVVQWKPGDPAWREWVVPQQVGWVIPLHGTGDVLAGLQQGVARLNLGAGLQMSWVCRLFERTPALRLNDAKADVTGALWAGSLNCTDESQTDGAFFRIVPATGHVDLVDTGYTVANGPAIHPSGTWLLHNDSGRRTIFAFDLDAAAARLTKKRVWKELAPEEGYPDGMTFDAEGNLWLAHWGAGCISCYASDGSLRRRVRLPASHITNVCFGGAALDRLFVTSARAGLSPEQLAAEPLAGALFEVDPQGARGLAGLPARA